MIAGNALVTGGARRIGRALALALAADGWGVAIQYRTSAKEAADTLSRCREAGSPGTAAIEADLTRPEQRDGLVDRAARELGGPLTLLVSSASGFHRDSLDVPDASAMDANLALEVAAPLVLTQSFARQLPQPAHKAQEEPVASGCIVFLADAAALRPASGFASYHLGKAALLALTRNAALELAPAIRVNALAPGPVLPASRQGAEHFAQLRSRTPLQRGAELEEVVAGLRYLLASPSLTGQILAIDGGMHLQPEADG